VLVEKVLQARRHFAALGASVSKLVGNVVRNIRRPALGGVEGHDPHRVFKLPFERMPHQCPAVCLRIVRFAPSRAEPPEVVRHEIGVKSAPSQPARC
jgi:hypothetical protein